MNQEEITERLELDGHEVPEGATLAEVKDIAREKWVAKPKEANDSEYAVALPAGITEEDIRHRRTAGGSFPVGGALTRREAVLLCIEQLRTDAGLNE